jgi:hypothetical protein
MRGCRLIWLVLSCLGLAWPARADGIDSIYSPDMLSEWQYRVGAFIQGVFRENITPALTPDEIRQLRSLRFDFPALAPGQEPLAFWSDGDAVHLSAASMKFVGDLMLAYVWFGRNGYVETSLDKYMLMLACWSRDSAPLAPRIALQIPENAGSDADTDLYVTRLTRDAYQFIMLHEIGHVLHDPPMASPDAVHSIAMEIAADRFALDVLSRLHQVPTGASTLFQILSFYETGACARSPGQAARHLHPLNRDRLRQVALDISDSADKYAKDAAPETLALFRSLTSETESLADQLDDPAMREFLQQQATTIGPGDLAPQRVK